MAASGSRPPGARAATHLGKAGVWGVGRGMWGEQRQRQLREAVQVSAGRVITEASGGVTVETVGAIAATGVDFISAGALTHSAPAIDISLEVTVE